jgi:hypothetical protein
MPNPHPGGPCLCIYIPQRQGGPVIPLGTHFSRLLRHAWVTVGLFLFPDHHTGRYYNKSDYYYYYYYYYYYHHHHHHYHYYYLLMKEKVKLSLCFF